MSILFLSRKTLYISKTILYFLRFNVYIEKTKLKIFVVIHNASTSSWHFKRLHLIYLHILRNLSCNLLGCMKYDIIWQWKFTMSLVAIEVELFIFPSRIAKIWNSITYTKYVSFYDVNVKELNIFQSKLSIFFLSTLNNRTILLLQTCSFVNDRHNLIPEWQLVVY